MIPLTPNMSILMPDYTITENMKISKVIKFTCKMCNLARHHLSPH